VPKRILLVEPDAVRREAFSSILARVADVDAHTDFSSARHSLPLMPYDLLVTQLRLGPYNGLHLVYLARRLMIRSVVYAASTDVILAREAQLAGAFYERADHLAVALSHYVGHALPSVDRRNPGRPDRRSNSRGGRRVTDDRLMPAT
jgi:DNA-binding NtrC family response regulator